MRHADATEERQNGRTAATVVAQDGRGQQVLVGVDVAVDGAGSRDTEFETGQNGHQGFPGLRLCGIVPVLQTLVFGREGVKKKGLGVRVGLEFGGKSLLLCGNGVEGSAESKIKRMQS